MKLDTVTRYYVEYHDPRIHKRFTRPGFDAYWCQFYGGPDGGRWLTAREAREAFTASKHSHQLFRVVKVTQTTETVVDID